MTCEWQYIEDDGYWESNCGLSLVLTNDASLEENDMHYCPKCGGKIFDCSKQKEDKIVNLIQEEEMTIYSENETYKILYNEETGKFLAEFNDGFRTDERIFAADAINDANREETSRKAS